MDGPVSLEYDGLDPQGSYELRLYGYRDAIILMDGKKVEPTQYGKEMGELKTYPVPSEALQDGSLDVRWNKPDESHLNWREYSRLAEVWLVKK